VEVDAESSCFPQVREARKILKIQLTCGTTVREISKHSPSEMASTPAYTVRKNTVQRGRRAISQNSCAPASPLRILVPAEINRKSEAQNGGAFVIFCDYHFFQHQRFERQQAVHIQRTHFQFSADRREIGRCSLTFSLKRGKRDRKNLCRKQKKVTKKH
jgi:hypothetical protein